MGKKLGPQIEGQVLNDKRLKIAKARGNHVPSPLLMLGEKKDGTRSMVDGLIPSYLTRGRRPQISQSQNLQGPVEL